MEKIDCAYIERYGGGNSRTIDSTTAFFFSPLNTTSNYSNDRHEILKEEHGEKLARLQSNDRKGTNRRPWILATDHPPGINLPHGFERRIRVKRKKNNLEETITFLHVSVEH